MPFPSGVGTVDAVKVFVIAFWVFAVTMVVIQTIRARKYGPTVNWIPKRWRPWVNDYYRRHGWREPYDAEGNRRNWWRS